MLESLAPRDVCVSITDAVCEPLVSVCPGVMKFHYDPIASVDALFLTLRMCGGSVGSAREIHMGTDVVGRHLHTFSVSRSRDDSHTLGGIVLSQDGRRLAASFVEQCVVKVYAPASGEEPLVLGRKGAGPGCFHSPLRMCLSRKGNLLVAEDYNERVQEVTWSGVHVRYYGVGAVNNHVMSVAAGGDHIAIGTTTKVFLYAARSGMFVASFGGYGSAPDKLSWSRGLTFTPDNSAVVITDSGNDRLTVINLDGSVRETLGAKELACPSDVAFTSGGNMVVGELRQHRVCVLSHTGVVLRRWSVGSEFPLALRMHRDKLYVIFRDSPHIAVFE